MHTHTHTLNLGYWEHELNHIFTLLKIASCNYSLDNDVAVLIGTALDKTSKIHCQVGDAINAQKVMEKNSESSKL